MCLASAGNTAVASYLGKLVDSVDPTRNTQGLLPDAIMRNAAGLPGLIGLAYLVRESMNVLRRYPRREHLHAHQQRHVRSAHRPPDEGGSLDPGPGPGRGPLRPDHPQLRMGSSGSSGSASSISSRPS